MKQLLITAGVVFAAALNNLIVNAAENDISLVPKKTPEVVSQGTGAYNEKVGICAILFAVLALLIFIIITIIRIRKRRRRTGNIAADGSQRRNTGITPFVPSNVASDTEMYTVPGSAVIMHMARISSDYPYVYDVTVREPVIIGSSPAMSNIVVDKNSGVHPRHCMIACEDDNLVIVEHAPKTFVNGVPLNTSRYVLSQGDKLKLGDMTFRINWRKP